MLHNCRSNCFWVAIKQLELEFRLMKEFFLKGSRIDENKAYLTETRSWILMQEFLLNMCSIIIVSVEAGLMKNRNVSRNWN